ncbi:glutathione S-transferase [uncultured Paraglaciecola sp.]|uniref:glutathione S-transferase n=1 Tax=uncultured Paraglaciecola sp. TaxID=1765024 RepID=UPI0025E1462F|nr:glutathione S-transferase [uncultured Paraglaciecola sp.]
MSLPILYSLRNCPYAMRARIGIHKAQLQIDLREVNLKQKPAAMLAASAKGTVPILVKDNAPNPPTVIDESLDVMLWALTKNDPDDLLHGFDQNALPKMLDLIRLFDDEFKTCLNAYKAASRYREDNVTECRQASEVFIQGLENRLNDSAFLMSAQESLADIALMPFIRQFAKVERQWYLQAPYPRVREWLNFYLQSGMFTRVMAKFDFWVGDGV